MHILWVPANICVNSQERGHVRYLPSEWVFFICRVSTDSWRSRSHGWYLMIDRVRQLLEDDFFSCSTSIVHVYNLVMMLKILRIARFFGLGLEGFARLMMSRFVIRLPSPIFERFRLGRYGYLPFWLKIILFYLNKIIYLNYCHLRNNPKILFMDN